MAITRMLLLLHYCTGMSRCHMGKSADNSGGFSGASTERCVQCADTCTRR